MMYLFHIRCVDCGNQMAHQADAAVTPTATAALAKCTQCGITHRIDLRVTPVRPEGKQTVRMDDIEPATDYGRTLITTIHTAEDNP